MTSHNFSFVVSDRYLWLAVGVFAVCAAYTAQSQLKTFKARCISRQQDQVSPDDTAAERMTENGSLSSSASKEDSRMAKQILTIDLAAVNLESLEDLARGANFDLRNAAIRIITERATNCTNIDVLRKQIESQSPSVRLRALKAMHCLAVTICRYRISHLPDRERYWESEPFIELHKRGVFDSLIKCLNNTLPPNEDTGAQKEALLILARLIENYYPALEMMVEAGIIGWLKMLKIPGYETSVLAAIDTNNFDPSNPSLLEIISGIMREMKDGRKLMIEAGLIPDTNNGSGSRGIETSVEMEMEIADVMNGSAQRAWEGTLEGLLNMGNLPSESHWTEG